MKIRSGFVSNSSSSSFLIYGICMEYDELLNSLNVSEKERESDNFDWYDIVVEKISNLELEFHNPNGYDCCYIGRSWATIGDNETGKQFKDKVKTDLTSIFGDKLNFDTFEEAYYN